MGLVDRFTRDDVSKYVWGSLMLAAILGLVFAFNAGGDAVREERVAAERRSVQAVEDVIAPRLGGVSLAGPISGPALSSLRDAVERSILVDERVARVRIWSADGTLLFSTDRADDPGSNAALNDEVLRRVADGATLTRWNLSDVGGIDEEGRSFVRTYAPVRSAIAEIDHIEAGTVGPIAASWLRFQIAAAAAAALFLLMTVLSLRDPVERINAGVSFAPSAVPAGYSLIDDERLHAVEEVYRLAHERVAKLEARLAESEELRRRLEGDLQRALTTAATGAVTAPPSAAAPAPTSAEPAHGPMLTDEVPSRPQRLVERAVQPAAPAASAAPVSKQRRTKRATRERPRTEPSRPERPEERQAPSPAAQAPPPAAEAPPPAAEAPAPVAPAPRPVEAPAAATQDPAPGIVTVPESEVLGDRRPAEPTDAPEKPKRQLLRRKAEPAGEPAAAPRVVATAPAAAADADDARAHAAALETFIRLTESDRQHHESGDVDQGAVRAALARTAARKKPGSARLQSHEEPVEERLGGPPPRER